MKRFQISEKSGRMCFFLCIWNKACHQLCLLTNIFVYRAQTHINLKFRLFWSKAPSEYRPELGFNASLWTLCNRKIHLKFQILYRRKKADKLVKITPNLLRLNYASGRSRLNPVQQNSPMRIKIHSILPFDLLEMDFEAFFYFSGKTMKQKELSLVQTLKSVMNEPRKQKFGPNVNVRSCIFKNDSTQTSYFRLSSCTKKE